MIRPGCVILAALLCLLASCRQDAGREPAREADSAAVGDTVAVPPAEAQPAPGSPAEAGADAEDAARPAGAAARAEADFEHDFTRFFRDAEALRERYPLLSRGDLTVLPSDTTLDITVYARSSGSEAIVVAVNRSDEAHSLRVELPERLRHVYETELTTQPEGYRVQQDATALLLELPERFGLILTARSDG